jgi:fatty acid transporter, putative
LHVVQIAQYIGETCRFLLTQPPSSLERSHSVHTMFGNGLRLQFWRSFKERFGIKNIIEVYGATESNGSLLNIDNKEGACGFISVNLPTWLIRRIYPVSLVKVDLESGDPIRDENGMCIPCAPSQCGLLIGKIENNHPFKDFSGYVDKAATTKKIIKDVFQKGDSYFSSGDLLTMDEYGYFYFTDRFGDNIRWKGENISTGEVEGIISNLVELADCVFYGIEIPGYEGKAGMLAILDPSNKLKLEELLEEMKKALPSYSIPLIIRIVSKLEMTTTFKLPKTTLAKESFNPNQVKDPLFILDSKANSYVKFDSNIYNDLISGKFAV